MKRSDQAEWAWVAGIIEGEGYLGCRRRKPHDRQETYGYDVRIQVAMTDFDVVQRLAEITGVGKVNAFADSRNKAWQDVLRWDVFRRADVIHVLSHIMPWLGDRRLDAAERILSLGFAWPQYCKDKDGYARDAWAVSNEAA